MNQKIPEVTKTKRLLLKIISLEYKENIFKEFTPEIVLYMTPKPAETIQDTIDFINSSIKKNYEGKNFQIVIVDKDTNEFLGCGSLNHIDTKTPELGIWIKKSAHGHGYGMETMQALKGWADNNLDYQYIIYPVAEENIASRRIPESMGGKVEKEIDEKNGLGQEMHFVEYHIYPSTNVIIKELSEEEIPKVVEISKIIFNVTDVGGKYHDKNLWEERLDKNGILLGAYYDEKLVGYKFGYEENKETFHSWMGGVLEEFRGNKIATKLLSFQENLLKDRGYKYITVNTVESKYPEMFKLLLKQGYIVESTTQQKEPDGSVVIKSNFKKIL
jgi:RimJ/RimL family protein N-acetyltransferase/GNAT superfamily N-acetyltransferase